LDDVEFPPSVLQRFPARGFAEGFDRRYLAFPNQGDWSDAGSPRLAVDMDGACAAQCDATPEFGAGKADHVTKHPQERSVAIDIRTMAGAVHGYGVKHLPQNSQGSLRDYRGPWKPQQPMNDTLCFSSMLGQHLTQFYNDGFTD
jgi:hypothetical protein